MSYRPTISVYVNGHIADIGYYRNWDDKDLFFEAVAIAALFSECKSVQEYNEKKFGRQKVIYWVEPEEFENTEENLKFFESCSEWPILVDLTAKCIYISEGAKEGEELAAIPSALDEYSLAVIEEYEEHIPAATSISVRNVEFLMSHCKIPLSQVDMDEVLNMYLKYDELQEHLSTTVVELLQKEKQTRLVRPVEM